jgi:hypothetical protein
MAIGNPSIPLKLTNESISAVRKIGQNLQYSGQQGHSSFLPNSTIDI